MPENQGVSQASSSIDVYNDQDQTKRLSNDSGQAALIYATLPTLDAARSLGRRLVAAKLAACVNIIPGMVAIYAFEGRLQEDDEVVCVIKTRRALSGACIAAVCEGHAYINPAAIRLDVSGGASAYLAWLVESTRRDESDINTK